MAKIKITIEGYGTVKIRKPKDLNNKTFVKAVAKAVAKTMTIADPRPKQDRFHPVLGSGGYRG